MSVTKFALLLASAIPLLAATPTIGQKAPDFTLPDVHGKQTKFSDMAAHANTVLVVLRGYPGYQCPFCNRQVQDFISNSQAFADAGVHVVFVYPGPPESLNTKANEFLTGKTLPDNFQMLLDPNYRFTQAYGLRWDAANETAYPSTFLIDSSGQIYFEKIAKSHGGRATAAEVIDMLPKPKK